MRMIRLKRTLNSDIVLALVFLAQSVESFSGFPRKTVKIQDRDFGHMAAALAYGIVIPFAAWPPSFAPYLRYIS